jgi:hypothetical protein
VPSDG